MSLARHNPLSIFHQQQGPSLPRPAIWLVLTQRKADGGDVDSKDIRKHRNDVLRLYQVLLPILPIELPELIRKDLTGFLQAVEPELSPQSLKQLGIKEVDAADVLQTIKTVYGITEE